MRRTHLPKISFPAENADDLSKNDRPVTRHSHLSTTDRHTQLPPVDDNPFLLGPPPGKPQYGRRAARHKNDLHESKSQIQALPAVSAVPAAPSVTNIRQTPLPWDREDRFLSYKDYMSQKTPFTPANIKLPDIREVTHTSRNHLRVRPVNKDMLILNEIEYSYEPAKMPSNISQEFLPPVNGRTMRIKSPRVRATSRATSIGSGSNGSNGSNTSLENIPPTCDRSSVSPQRLPPLEKFLQKRGISRNNYYQ